MAKDAEKKPKKQSAKPKNTPKKESSAKSTKKSAPKKTTPKKQPAKEPEKKTLFQKKTIAQRTVAFKTTNWRCIFSWIGIVICMLLAVFFNFFMLGYSFTVIVLFGIAGLLLLYGTLIPLFAKTYPMTARRLKLLLTALVCIGLILAAITEFYIIRASLGEPKESCDYVVVLGAKVRSDGPSVALMERICGARDYLQAHPDVIAVVSGGQGPDEPMTEAQAMYDELVKMGIDESRLWIENQAIEEKTGIRPDNIGIISSEYHLFRASLFADACGVESVLIPAQTTHLSQKINHFMREVAGVWYYLILGGQYE